MGKFPALLCNSRKITPVLPFIRTGGDILVPLFGKALSLPKGGVRGDFFTHYCRTRFAVSEPTTILLTQE